MTAIEQQLQRERMRQSDVADYLGINHKGVRRLADSGELPVSLRVGASEFWFKEDVDAFVLKQNPQLAQ